MNAMGVTGDLALEAVFIGKALLTGAALGVYYDLYRILRRVFHFGYAMILGQDLLFWVTGAIGVFFSSMVATGGQLRIVFVLAAFVGWGIYAATVGSVLMIIVDRFLGLFSRVAAVVGEKVISPMCGCVSRKSRTLYVAFAKIISRILQKLREKREKTS